MAWLRGLPGNYDGSPVHFGDAYVSYRQRYVARGVAGVGCLCIGREI
jgi:hypothetical protein